MEEKYSNCKWVDFAPEPIKIYQCIDDLNLLIAEKEYNFNGFMQFFYGITSLAFSRSNYIRANSDKPEIFIISFPMGYIMIND